MISHFHSNRTYFCCISTVCFFHWGRVFPCKNIQQCCSRVHLQCSRYDWKLDMGVLYIRNRHSINTVRRMTEVHNIRQQKFLSSSFYQEFSARHNELWWTVILCWNKYVMTSLISPKSVYLISIYGFRAMFWDYSEFRSLPKETRTRNTDTRVKPLSRLASTK